jgi:hypothetical protein
MARKKVTKRKVTRRRVVRKSNTQGKVYKKVHTNPLAAKNHKKAIKKRGGKVTEEKKGDKIILTYTF